MSRTLFIRICGWCLVLSVVALLLGMLASALFSGTTDPRNLLYRPYDPWLNTAYQVMIPTWALLSALGVAGLAVRFGSASGRLGQAVLFAGALGGMAAFGSFLLLLLAGENEPEGVWTIAMLGLIVMFASLVFFGIPILWKRALDKWSWLPLATGAGFFLAFVLSSTIWKNSTMPVPVIVLFILVAFGLSLLGRLILRKPAGEFMAA